MTFQEQGHRLAPISSIKATEGEPVVLIEQNAEGNNVHAIMSIQFMKEGSAYGYFNVNSSESGLRPISVPYYAYATK